MSAGAQIIFSLGFGILYWEMAGGLAGFEESAPIIGLMATIAYLVAFFVPQALFRYMLKETAAAVLTQLSRRFVIAAGVTLLLNIVVAAILLQGTDKPVPIVMEVYSATLMGLIVFHALGGLMAEQANYLQRTKQYNTNQLFAAVVALSVLFVFLMMYFLAFDLGATRAPRIYVRDMIFSTLAISGFAWFVYRLGHH
jgi:hypothetical protein